MSQGPLRFPVQRRLAQAVLILAIVLSVLALTAAVLVHLKGDSALALAMFFGGMLTLPLATLIYCQISLLHKIANTQMRQYEAALDLSELARWQMEYARTVADNSSLSDWVKRIVYREKDFDFVRDSVEGAIVRQDWETAEHLIRELGEELGYPDEAKRLREQVTKARASTVDERVAVALKRFEQLCEAHKWEQALREAERLQTLFPNVSSIRALPSAIEQRRAEFKRALLKRYDEAVRGHRLDEAHDLLVELDQYLAPTEAAALKESARGVFKAKLLQMGVQFSLAVSDHQFPRAIEVGEELCREFPNSRYAQEIRGLLPTLRLRVGNPVSHEPVGTR